MARHCWKMYSSESAFSSALLTAINAKAKRLLIQRIESGETARGIPDVYIRNKTREYWIELKNVKRLSVNNTCWQIPWRPGQKAWASRYYRCAGLCSFTIVALKDGYMIIPMRGQYKNNTVYINDRPIRMTALQDVVDCIIEGLEKYVY
jgi:hypothetical protein